jgi:hypothetical protein
MTPENLRIESNGHRETEFELIQRQLKTNPRVSFAEDYKRRGSASHDPTVIFDNYFTDNREFIVGIDTENIDELNELMLSLVTITPSRKPKLAEKLGDGIKIGSLFFEETCGEADQTILTNIKSTEPEILEDLGLSAGETLSFFNHPIRRSITIRVYPDSEIASKMYEYESAEEQDLILPSLTFRRARFFLTPETAEQIKTRKLIQRQTKTIYHKRNLLHN